jgi:O-antigen ligase
MVYGVKNKQRLGLSILTLPLLLGFYTSERRAAYAGAIISIIVFIVLLPTGRRRTFLKYAVPCFIGILLYFSAFWNNQGTAGRPVQLIKSGFATSKNETTKKDYLSNLYRKDENYDLAQTIKKNPVIGIGFGNAFDEPLYLPRVAFPLQNYISHNEILWLIVKMGGVGFFAFWLFFNCYAARGTRLIRHLRDPYLKAIMIFTIIAVINQMVASFYDLQLTYYRNMIYLGCMMGLLKTIEMLHRNSGEKIKEVIKG